MEQKKHHNNSFLFNIIAVLLFCIDTSPVSAETFEFDNAIKVNITPPDGWQTEKRENLYGPGYHGITLVADETRKPGCTISISMDDRLPAQTEKSFLQYVNEIYSRSSFQFIERTPSFSQLNINNGIAYYFAANYAEYYEQPPAEGRAKVCGILLIYRENSPLISASLYVDDMNDPALELMINSILGMEIILINYPKKIINFDNNNSIKIDIPVNWGVSRRRGTPVQGLGRTYDLVIDSPSNEKALLMITVGKTRNGTPFSREQFEMLINNRVKSLLPDAVEEEAKYIEVQLNNGYGIYCILTDASLVDKIPDDNDYKYVGVFYGNFNSGCILYSTILFDDIESSNFRQMLEILSSVDPLLN